MRLKGTHRQESGFGPLPPRMRWPWKESGSRREVEKEEGQLVTGQRGWGTEELGTFLPSLALLLHL